MTARVILVGGGLANCLIALRLQAKRPDTRLTVLEVGSSLGGNHTWSFHGTDVSRDIAAWLVPLAPYAWPHYDVRFPDRERRLHGAYHALTSERLHEATRAALGDRVRLNTGVGRVAADGVEIAGGEWLPADLVIDARGLAAGADGSVPGLTLRYQKFLGQLVRLESPHGLTGPLLMDATVSQEQGYRFVYLLPFAADQVLIEDTYYSDSGALDSVALRARIADYAAAQGWHVRQLLREETGVLPIVLDADFERFWPASDDGLPRAGLRAGLFHHTTGYSLPEAASLAEELAAHVHLGSAGVATWIRARVRRRWREQRLFRFLNRMLFLAAAPVDRYRILQHFYRLPEQVIDHFYAGRLTSNDARHILTGTPPIPIHRALRYVLPSSSRAQPVTKPLEARGAP
jgi:lycopene beta-cyclase